MGQMGEAEYYNVVETQHCLNIQETIYTDTNHRTISFVKYK